MYDSQIQRRLSKGWIRVKVGQNSIWSIKAPILRWNLASKSFRTGLPLLSDCLKKSYFDFLYFCYIFFPCSFPCLHYISYYVYAFGKKTGVDILRKKVGFVNTDNICTRNQGTCTLSLYLSLPSQSPGFTIGGLYSEYR